MLSRKTSCKKHLGQVSLELCFLSKNEKEKRKRLQRKKDEEREGTMIRGLEEDKQGDKNEERDRCKKKRPT